MPVTTEDPVGAMTLDKPKTGLVNLSSEVTDKLYALAGAKAPEPPPSQVKEPAAAPQDKLGAVVKPQAAVPPKEVAKVEAAKPEATPTEPAKPEAKEEMKGPKQLREAFEKAQAKVTEVMTSLDSTSKEKAEALSRLAKTEEALGAAQKRLTEELEPLRKVHEEQAKRLQEREEALMLARYEATDEYHSTFVKPIADKHAEALQFTGELVVQGADGKEVQATPEHLAFVLSAPNNNEAARRAEQLLGQGSPFVGQLVNYRTQLRALEIKRQEGLKNGQLKAKEFHQRQQVMQTEQLQRRAAAVAEREKTYMADLSLPGNDPELASEFSKARALADLMTHGSPDMTEEKLADTIAQTRAAVQQAPVLRKLNGRLQAEVAELKKQLAAYQGSEPSVQTRNGDGAPAPEPDNGVGTSTLDRLRATELAKLTRLGSRR